MVVLDRFRAGDMRAHLAGEDEELARRFGWWPKRSGPEHYKCMLAEDDEAWTTGGLRRKLAARVGGELVGGCEIRLEDEGLARVSYWTFPAHRNRGYATRSLRLLAEWALGELGVERLEAEVEPDNVASAAAARGAGFSRSGRTNPEGMLVFERRR